MTWQFAAVGIGASLVGGVVSARAERNAAKLRQYQAEHEARVAENNAALLEYEAADIVRAGKIGQERLGEDARALIGRIEAAQSTSGFTLEGGDAHLLRSEARSRAREDLTELRRSTRRQVDLTLYKAASLRHGAAVTRLYSRPSGLEGIGALLGAAGQAATIASGVDDWGTS